MPSVNNFLNFYSIILTLGPNSLKSHGFCFCDFVIFGGKMTSRTCRQILALLISQLIKWNSLRGIEWSLRAFASMRAVSFFLRARAVINLLMRAASTLEITNGEQ